MPNYTAHLNEIEMAAVIAALFQYKKTGCADHRTRPADVDLLATKGGTLMESLDSDGVEKLSLRLYQMTVVKDKPMTRTLQRRLQEATDMATAFNSRFPIGTAIIYYELIDPPAKPHETKTRSQAWVMGGHSAMIMVDGVSGGVALEHVRVK